MYQQQLKCDMYQLHRCDAVILCSAYWAHFFLLLFVSTFTVDSLLAFFQLKLFFLSRISKDWFLLLFKYS